MGNEGSSLILNYILFFSDLWSINMALNNFSVTDFTSVTLGTFLEQNNVFIALSYRGVEEFPMHTGNQRGYKSSDVVQIKIPGYPELERGMAVTASPTIDRVVPYTTSDLDIYNVTREIDIRQSYMRISGGLTAFTENPYREGKPTPGAKMMIDNYVRPAGLRINGEIEKVMSEKCNASAFYTPIQRPADLQPLNSFASISQVEALMTELGWPYDRYGIMNPTDARTVSDSLQNSFYDRLNKTISDDAVVGGMANGRGGRLAGFDLYRSNAIEDTAVSAQYSANPTNTGVTVDSVASDGSTITFAGFASGLTPAITAGTLIAIPSVNLINKVNKLTKPYTLVICAAADANSIAGGLCTVTLSEPLAVTGEHQNVNSLPSNGAVAEVFPGHRNNYFFIPMGIIANPIPALDEIRGAENGRYESPQTNMYTQSMIQGLVTNGINTIRLLSFVPTLAIASYIINLPSPL